MVLSFHLQLSFSHISEVVGGNDEVAIQRCGSKVAGTETALQHCVDSRSSAFGVEKRWTVIKLLVSQWSIYF